MPVNLDLISDGQEVESLDGEDLGKVTHVWRNPGSGAVEGITPAAGEWGELRDLGAGGPTSGDLQEGRILESLEARGTNAGDIGETTAGASEVGPDQSRYGSGGPSELSIGGLGIPGYLEVSGPSGLLGTRHLYVPFTAVREVGYDRVVLEVDKDQAHELYRHRPEGLS